MMRAKSVFVCLILLFIVVDSFNLNDLSDKVQKNINPIMEMLKPPSRSDNSKDLSTKFRKAVSELSSQFSAIKESVQNLERGGYIKKSSLPTQPEVPTEIIDGVLDGVETIPESIPPIPTDDFEVPEPFNLNKKEVEAIHKMQLIESMLLESEILQLVSSIERTLEAEDTRYTAPPTKEPEQLSPPADFKLESSPVVESRAFIEGMYSAAQVASISKIAKIHSDTSLPDLQDAYEQLVISSKNQLTSFFDKLDNIPRNTVCKRDIAEDADCNADKAVAINIDVIITLDTNAALIPKVESSVQGRSEARGCLSDHIQSGSLVLSGNGMICQDGNENCKQCLYEVYQQAAQM